MTVNHHQALKDDNLNEQTKSVNGSSTSCTLPSSGCHHTTFLQKAIKLLFCVGRNQTSKEASIDRVKAFILIRFTRQSGFLSCLMNLPISIHICGFCREQVCEQSFSNFLYSFCIPIFFFFFFARNPSTEMLV